MKRTPLTHILITICFFFTSFGPMPKAEALDALMPRPGTMVGLSPEFQSPLLKGIKVDPTNPFKFNFILDQGEVGGEELKTEANKLIRYFLASLTVPEKDLWVNLSPYEKDRIVPESFSMTDMGRDLLAQDYLLKQITASLIYPEDDIGQLFWKKVYEEAAKKLNSTNVPLSTFNKVWIVPEKAVVYENAQAGTAYIIESKLKVMMEDDYLAQEKNSLKSGSQEREVINQITREIVLPKLTQEINEGKNFSQLRQIYHSLILANWYKQKLKNSILNEHYSNANKVDGIKIDNLKAKEEIYESYLKAFKKGVYNYIKEEKDPVTHQLIPRKYFSGGINYAMIGQETSKVVQWTTSLPTDTTINTRPLVNIYTQINTFRTLQSDFPGIKAAKEITHERIYKETLEALFSQDGAMLSGSKVLVLTGLIALSAFAQEPTKPAKTPISEVQASNEKDYSDTFSKLFPETTREKSPDIALKMWEVFAKEGTESFKRMHQDFPLVFSLSPQKQSIRIEELMQELRDLDKKENPWKGADKKEELRRLILSVLTIFRSKSDISPDLLQMAKFHALTADLSFEFDGLNASHQMQVGHRMLDLRIMGLIGILAHELGHNIHPLGSNANSNIGEFIADIYANFLLEQVFGKDALLIVENIRKDIEIKVKEYLALKRPEIDISEDEHYVNTIQMNSIKRAYKNNVDWKSMYMAINEMGEDYMSNKLNQKIKDVIDLTKVAETKEVHLEDFIHDLLKRYSRISGTQLKPMKTGLLRLKSADNTEYKLFYFNGWREKSDRAMIFRDLAEKLVASIFGPSLTPEQIKTKQLYENNIGNLFIIPGYIYNLFQFVEFKKDGKLLFLNSQTGAYETFTLDELSKLNVRQPTLEELNSPSPNINADTLAVHGTNAFALLNAFLQNNGQLRPGNDIVGPVLTGENLATSPLNESSISTITVDNPNASIEPWYYAEDNASKFVLTLENIDKRRLEDYPSFQRLSDPSNKADAQIKAWKEKFDQRLKQAKEHLVRLKDEGKYEEYLKLSKIPVTVIGDGYGRLNYKASSGIGGELAFKRLNIRGIGVKESDYETLKRFLADNGINIPVIKETYLNELLRQHKYSVRKGAFPENYSPLLERLQSRNAPFLTERQSIKDNYLEGDFLKDFWVDTAKFSYKIWVEGEKVKLQRYNIEKDDIQENERTFNLNEPIKVGRSGTESSNYYLVRSEAENEHFESTISRTPKGDLHFKVKDLNTASGTTIQWTNYDSAMLLNPKGKIQFDNLLQRFKNLNERGLLTNPAQEQTYLMLSTLNAIGFEAIQKMTVEEFGKKLFEEAKKQSFDISATFFTPEQKADAARKYQQIYGKPYTQSPLGPIPTVMDSVAISLSRLDFAWNQVMRERPKITPVLDALGINHQAIIQNFFNVEMMKERNAYTKHMILHEFLEAISFYTNSLDPDFSDLTLHANKEVIESQLIFAYLLGGKDHLEEAVKVQRALQYKYENRDLNEARRIMERIFERALNGSLLKEYGITETASNPAMNAENNTGGIDLTSNKTLEVKNNGEEIKFNIDAAMIEEIKNAKGFVPVIINMQPMTDLKTFLTMPAGAAL